MKNKINIVRLSSNISTKIGYNPNRLDTNKLYYFEQGAVADESQHLYFLSDEEIKKGDYVIDETGLFGPVEREDVLINPKKIIATTDESLKIELPSYTEHKNITSLPRPTNEFLKRYCELGGVDEVLIEYEEYTETKYSSDIDISIPAIKLKVAPDNTINVSFIEEKMYSRKEVVELLSKAFYTDNRNWSNRFQDYIDVDFDEWLKDNFNI